jgi:hypothetical protein
MPRSHCCHLLLLLLVQLLLLPYYVTTPAVCDSFRFNESVLTQQADLRRIKNIDSKTTIHNVSHICHSLFFAVSPVDEERRSLVDNMQIY